MEGVTTITIPWTLFDVVIFGLLIVGAALLVEMLHRHRKERRNGRRVLALLVVAICWGVLFYGSFIEPRMLVVQERDIRLHAGEEVTPHRVVVVADTHVGPYKGKAWAQNVVDRVNEIEAEIVLFPGDFVFDATEQVEMLSPLADVNKPFYAVLGNHDHEFADADAVAERLDAFGLTMLRNEAMTITFADGDQISLAGIDDVWFTADIEQTVQSVDDTLPVIMLAHNPDYILDETSERVDLVLAGHTHCGQIRLPGVGPVPPLPTKLGKAYDCGLFGYGTDSLLYITPGVGETGPRARLFNPPTIDVLTLWF